MACRLTCGRRAVGACGWTDAPARPARRQRIWGSMGMMQSLLGDKACWLQARRPPGGAPPAFASQLHLWRRRVLTACAHTVCGSVLLADACVTSARRACTRLTVTVEQCWVCRARRVAPRPAQHMALNPDTGLDPESPEVKLRASEGLLGVDYFFPVRLRSHACTPRPKPMLPPPPPRHLRHTARWAGLPRL